MYPNTESIDETTRYITDHLFNIIDSIYGKNINFKQTTHPLKKQPWFNKDCNKAKSEFNLCRNQFNRVKNNTNRDKFVEARQHYDL